MGDPINTFRSAGICELGPEFISSLWSTNIPREFERLGSSTGMESVPLVSTGTTRRWDLQIDTGRHFIVLDLREAGGCFRSFNPLQKGSTSEREVSCL